MFARGATALLSLAFLVSASHLKARDTCGGGQIYCCDTESMESSNTLGLISSIIAADADPSVLAKLNCVSVVGGDSCTQQAVCCENVQQNGVVNVACNPINLAL